MSKVRRLFVTCGVFTRYFFVAFSWFFRGFFVALFCLEKQCSGLFRYFFVVFSWLFRGPRFGQILRVLALKQSSVFLYFSWQTSIWNEELNEDWNDHKTSGFSDCPVKAAEI